MPASATKADPAEAKTPSGSQTLLRGLDLIDAISEGPIALAELAVRLGLTRSTTHRLASALIDRRFVTFTPRQGYWLGPKLLELGFLAQKQADVVQIARDHLQTLAAASEDTVHLGVRDQDHALYLDKIPGRRRVDISSRIGDRQPMTSTGLGKALMLDDPERLWRPHFDAEGNTADYDQWLRRMRQYVASGFAFDLEENEDQIRCVAAPIRDTKDSIVAAISVSSAAQYMSDDRMMSLTKDVLASAHAISRDLGWRGR
ncbi:IclR family transcriptional regulator [Sphingomonas sp.]|uniref:IclR family transcriptional regulator n=1 Tax=Sphingomonas sp. TaxID=28214 RepID=UPI0031CE84E0